MTRRLASASLFVRVLAVLLGAVLATQMLTFLLVLMVPSPPQHVTRLSSVATALASAGAAAGDLAVTVGPAPEDNIADPREIATGRALAASLGVPPAQVRVVLRRMADFDSPSSAGGGPRDLTRAPPVIGPAAVAGAAPPPPGESLDLLVGRFEAALQLPDGRWRKVAPPLTRIDRWQWEALEWLLGILLVVTPIAYLLARRLSAPITAFTAAAERLGRNPTGEPIAVAGPPEIAAAATAFNDMQARLRRYVEDRTTMVGAIAHDLRTPLMRLSLRLQHGPDAIREACEGDIREIEQMAASALSFVRDLARHDDRHRVSLRSIVETVVDDLADRGADVGIEPGDDATLLADPGAIRRMIDNVAGNALAYAGAARVRLIVGGGVARVEVGDRGPGIPAAELDRVFEPFYRVEQSRNRNTGGTGLGLASARAVARGHGGDIVLTNRDTGGLLACITLPL